LNVFASSPSPVESAQWLANAHVIKMVTESAQITSTALRLMGIEDDAIYRTTHKGHPCTRAAAEDPAYFWWVLEHGFALGDEYEARYGRVHASVEKLRRVQELTPFAKPDHGPSRFPLAMPEEHKGGDPHEAYRRYLRAKYAAWGQTNRPASWRRVVEGNPFVSGNQFLYRIAA
jgi:hypothetical protein